MRNYTPLFASAAGVRPVPLDIHVQGFDISNFESRMQARPPWPPIERCCIPAALVQVVTGDVANTV